MTYTPRYYQVEANDAVLSYWAKGGDNPLVVMATGTGKSMSIAWLVRNLLQKHQDLRVICLVHVRELVEQNFMAMIRAWPSAPAGINSAGLNRRDKRSQIIFASIQSIYKEDCFSLGKRDLIIIDEAHLVPRDGEGMYRTFIDKMRALVPDLRVAGYTATPYRMGTGSLVDGDDCLFSEVVYDYGIRRGIEDGFLSLLSSVAGQTQIDTKDVHKSGGEFIQKELEVAADKDFITTAAVREIVAYGADRKSWLIFCTGVDHANHVADELKNYKISVDVVTGKTNKQTRRIILNAFKDKQIRALTNCNVLTTGFDAPSVDLIALLRPTLSPVLYVQMIGRGTRLAPEKADCLVLDFAGNIARHGPVDAVAIKKSKPKGEKDDDENIAGKKCPGCKSLLYKNALDCPICGYDFRAGDNDPLPAHDIAPDAVRHILSSGSPVWIKVSKVYLRQENNLGDSCRVEYLSGATIYREWVNFGSDSAYARARAASWWQKAGGRAPAPISTAVAQERASELSKIIAIQVRPKGKYFDVVNFKIEVREIEKDEKCTPKLGYGTPITRTGSLTDRS